MVVSPNGVIGLIALSHAEEGGRDESEHARTHHQLMVEHSVQGGCQKENDAPPIHAQVCGCIFCKHAQTYASLCNHVQTSANQIKLTNMLQNATNGFKGIELLKLNKCC